MTEPEYKTHLWAARHPESKSNVDDIHYGNNASLTMGGEQQSIQIFDRFQELGVELIVCSTAKRTFGSMNALASERGIECIGSDLFLEWHRPTVTIGKSNSDPMVEAELKKRLEGLGPDYVPQPGAESWGALAKRIQGGLTFIQDISRATGKKRIGMVTHGLFMRFIISSILLGWCDDELLPHLFRCMHARTKIRNAAFMHFCYGPEYKSTTRSWSVEFGDTSYLE